MTNPDRSRGEVHDPAAGWSDPPGLGRLVVTCSAIGVLLSLVLITLSVMAAGQVWQSSLALGAFVAIWGGLGFGSMIGGVLYLSRIEDTAKVRKAEATAAGSTGGEAAPAAAGLDASAADVA